MRRNAIHTIAVVLILAASGVFLSPHVHRASGDPSIIDNLDGTSTATWDFSTPGDYTLIDTEFVDTNITLERQPTFWWNSTSAADFAGPESETNIDRATWPGDVTMALTSGPGTLLTLQPGAAGEDTWLDKDNPAVNYGSATTMIIDPRNPPGRPILRFDLSSIPATAVIDGARLSLYQTSGIGNPFWATAYQITAQWAEAQATWDERLTGVSWTSKGGDFNPRNFNSTYLDNNAGWRVWNITRLADLWHRGVFPNYGLILDAPNPGADSDKVFFTSDYLVDPTRRPKLEIWYRVLGATAEYISKIGGPGTVAAWKNISWNPSVLELASDEFNGATLESKWAWVNSPASFDVGVTTPGHLHVVSKTGTDLNGGTFTGHVLANDVVGDFTITMKFNVSPGLDGQKSGLMILVNERNWYGIAKANVGGAGNWRVYATDDSATTIRTSLASGNPIPAWLRLQRAGDTYTASTSNDGSAWTVRDTYVPPLVYSRSVRTGFFISDGLSGGAVVADVDYIRITTGSDATVTVQTRIGDVIPVDATWSAWSPPYPTPSSSSMSSWSRYIQYRLFYSVSYPDHVPVIGDVDISWFRFAPAGTVETNDLVPGDLSLWESLIATENLNGQTITYQYSLDSGGGWTSVILPADLSSLSTATGKIRIRASLSTANTLISPQLIDVRVKFRHRLDHFYVAVPPTANAGDPFSATVSAKDRNNNTIVGWTGTVNLAAYLTDGVTPGGGTLGTVSLAIASGGTATLLTETYTKAETIRINATFGAIYGLSNPIAILPGPVSRITVTPDNITILAFDAQAFSASALDVFDNLIPGVNFTWTVGGGVGSLNVTWGSNVLFTSNPPIANGTLEAANSSVIGTAQIHVILGPPPWVSISYPASGAHITGTVPIAYANSSDGDSIQFDYDGGGGWTLIGMTGILGGTYFWDTSTLNFTGGSLRAIVSNNRTATNWTVVTPIEVDNAPPAIALGTIVDDQAGSGTITIPYVTDADVVRVDFSYFDGSWNVIGSDFTIDGFHVWTPGLPINGVTLLAVAVDEVDLKGAAEKQGVGNFTIGTNPPSIAMIPDLHVSVGLTYTLNLTFYVSDPDTPLASLGVTVSDVANVTANAGVFPSLDIVYGQVGTYLVTLWVSDGVDTAWTILRIIASATGPPALVVPLPIVIFDEDTTAVNALGAPATMFFSDPDLDPMTFEVYDAVILSLIVNGDNTIDIWAPANWSGSETLRLRAMDPSGGFAESAFLVIVRPTNDGPVLLTSFPDISFDEDTISLDVFGSNATFNFFDIDGDQLAISVLGGSNVQSQVNPNGTIDLSALADWNGMEFLRVRATDPSGSFAEGIFLVTVLPVNDAPFAIPPIPAVAFDEDTLSADSFGSPATAFFGDIDLDTLTISVWGGVNVFSIVNANNTVDFWASADWFGSEVLNLRATDPAGAYAEDFFLVTVRPMNDAPVLITAFPTVSFDEDTTSLDSFGGNAALHFLDVDLDVLTVSVLDGVNVLSRVNANGTIDFWAVANWSGSEMLRVRAMDPFGAYNETYFLVSVLPVNDLPIVIASVPSVSFDEDTIAIDVLSGTPSTFFFDREGDSLTYTVLGGSQLTSRVNGDLTVDLWAPPDWFGSETLRVRATEPAGGFVEATFLANVLPVNDAPILAPISPLQVDSGESISLDLTPYITDVDTDISLINATTDSPYITVNGLLLDLAYPEDQTEATFTVTISDGAATASQDIQISFIPPWFKSPYFLSVIPFGILLVVGMIAQRARWRPAKAFLVDDRLRLLREFTLDSRCEVTYEQAYEGGALDAVEKPVKIQKYHAQTVKGDALAVCLLAYGPVSLEQVEFAREMLVNVQDKFDEGIKLRLHAARTAENNLEDERNNLQTERESFSARSKAFAGAVDATISTMSKLSKESAIIRGRVASFSNWEERLKQQEQDVTQGMQELESLQKRLEARAQDIAKGEEVVAEKTETLKSEFARLADERKEFDEQWQERNHSISVRETDIEAKEQSLIQRESTLHSQMEDYNARLASLKSLETRLGEDEERLRHAQDELSTRMNENEQLSKSLEGREREVTESEATVAERTQILESEFGKLAAEKKALDEQWQERNQSIAAKEIEIEAKEESLLQKESTLRTQVEDHAVRIAELNSLEAKFREDEENLRKAQEQLIARERENEELSKSLEAKATTILEIEARKSEEYRSWQETVESQQALLRQQREAFEKELTEEKTSLEMRLRSIQEGEAKLSEQAVRIQTEQSRLDRAKEDLALLEGEVQKAMQAAEEVRTKAEAAKNSIDERESELEQRERTLREEASRLSDEFARRADDLKAMESEIVAKQSQIEEKNLDSTRHIDEWKERLSKTAKEMEAKAREMAQRETTCSSTEKKLRDWEDRLTTEEKDFEATLKRLETKEFEIQQASLRHADESERLQTEIEAVRQSMAEREATLLSSRERLERESITLQDRLDAKAKDLAELEKKLAERESGIAHDRQTFESERSSWASIKEKELTKIEEARSEIEEWTHRTEKLMEDSQRRATVATELEKLAQRHSDEVKSMEAKLEERRLAAESAERDAEKQISQLNEAAKRLGAREINIQAMMNDHQARGEKLNALENELSTTTQKLANERSALDEESQRLGKLMTEMEARRVNLEEREVGIKERQIDLANREQGLTGEFQRIENLTHDLQERETDIRSREHFVASVQNDISKRESILTKLEAEVRRNMEDLDRNRKGIDAKIQEVESARAEVERLRKDVLSKQARAEKEKVEAVNVQKELQKNMKFLQKKAVEILDKEERLRAREKGITDAETATQSQKEQLQGRERELNAERKELEQRLAKAESEAKKLKEQLDSFEKSAANTDEMQEWRRDIENRVKIVQRKAMDILSREERLRKKENELRALAERLGVRMEGEMAVHQDSQ